MTTERTLKKWRREALLDEKGIAKFPPDAEVRLTKGARSQLNNRVLRMTQELLDQHLLRIKRR